MRFGNSPEVVKEFTIYFAITAAAETVSDPIRSNPAVYKSMQSSFNALI